VLLLVSPLTRLSHLIFPENSEEAEPARVLRTGRKGLRDEGNHCFSAAVSADYSGSPVGVPQSGTKDAVFPQEKRYFDPLSSAQEQESRSILLLWLTPKAPCGAGLHRFGNYFCWQPLKLQHIVLFETGMTTFANFKIDSW